MSRKYKDIIKFRKDKGGLNRRKELLKESMDAGDLQFSTIHLSDYDRAFKEWVNNDLSITFEEKEIPTISLFANQRFGEYMQSWKSTDEKKNFLMNFKVITRENNPKPGTMYGDTRNIPGDRFYLARRIDTIDESGRPVYLDVRMKQPYCVDIVYTVSVVTNKFRMLNSANELINQKFKSITSYLNVNGNYVSMILENISDESEYQINDRQYYSQSYNIKVRGFIVNDDDYQVVEEPKITLACVENPIGGNNSSYAEIEEIIDPCNPSENDYKQLKITVNVKKCSNNISFTIDEPIILKKLYCKNIKYFRLSKNGNVEFTYSSIEDEKEIIVKCNKGDKLLIDNILMIKSLEDGGIIALEGYNPYVIVGQHKKND